MNKQEIDFADAFPSSIRRDMLHLASKLNLICKFDPTPPIKVIVYGEALYVPGRIYYTKQNLMMGTKLTEAERIAVNAYYTRHHDGYVREQCLRRILTNKENWIVPYVVTLVGEYVIEILDVIYKYKDKLEKEIYRAFIQENKEYMFLIKQKVTSYWNYYYLGKYTKEEYVGFKILKYFDEILENG
jgi:hypothetical protein